MTDVFAGVIPPPARALDLDAARRALALLCLESHYWQLQSVPAGLNAVLGGRYQEQLLAAAERLSHGQHLYLGINPVAPDLRKCAAIPDVVRRLWLLVDVDAVREDSGNPASDAEHEAARLAALQVIESLRGEGWPSPVIIDSGNGWHLLYRCDLPNDQATRNLIRAALKVLAESTASLGGGAVDHATHKANQHTKLPGSWSQKGTHTEERPFRQVRLCHVPERLELVTVEMLAALAGIEEGHEGGNGHAVPPAPRRDVFEGRVRESGDGGLAYARRALDGEVERVATARPGADEGRNNALSKAAWKMGQLIESTGISREECESALLAAALSSGLPEREARSTLTRQLTAGMAAPRQPAPRDNGRPAPKAASPEAAARKAEKKSEEADNLRGWSKGDRIIYPASEVTPREVEWLWPYRMPLGKLTTVAGLGGRGKTFLFCDITARVTAGLPWPDCGEPCTPGQVLFISGEDEPDDTLVPRMLRMGANMANVVFLKAEVQDRFTLADLDTLGEAMTQANERPGFPPVRFIAIDPPTAFLGDKNDHKNAELRGLLSPLKSWAAKWNVAIAFITHFNKASGQKIEAMMRVIGGVAWVNAVRAAHIFADDPEDPDRRVFVPMKNNLGPKRPGLSCQISFQPGEMAAVEWLGEIATTADEAVNNCNIGKAPSRGMAASEWLVERFRERLEWPSEDLFSAAKEEGISRNALFDAKRILQLPKARRHADLGGNVTWVWWVPFDWPPIAQQSAEGDRAQQAPVSDCDEHEETF